MVIYAKNISRNGLALANVSLESKVVPMGSLEALKACF